MQRRDVVFRSIYRANRWHGTETRSGPGSTTVSTKRLRRILPELVSGMGVTSVLDAACGASFWMPDLPGYVGVDIVPEAVEAVEAAFPGRLYMTEDICTADLPRCEMVIARDVLAHLSNAEVMQALENFRRSGAIWALLTTFEDAVNDADTRTGGYREYDLEREPFSLGEPWLVIEDGYWEDELVYPSKLMGLWTL